MQHGTSFAAILGLIGMTTLGCADNPIQPLAPSPPPPPVEGGLPIASPSPPASDARALAPDETVEEDLSTGPVPPSCPKAERANWILFPCRQFNFVAPATGVLRVTLTLDSRETDPMALVVGGIESDRSLHLPKVVRVRVTGGENYRITAFLTPSHLDFDGWWLGPFQLVAKIE